MMNYLKKSDFDIFKGIANKMGIGSVKWELEDLSFFYLKPNKFQEIKKLVANRRDVREKQINHLYHIYYTFSFPVLATIGL